MKKEIIKIFGCFFMFGIGFGLSVNLLNAKTPEVENVNNVETVSTANELQGSVGYETIYVNGRRVTVIVSSYPSMEILR